MYDCDTDTPAPRIDEPPTLLAAHRDRHREIGLQLRDQAMRTLERSQEHLAASQAFEAARLRVCQG